MTPLHVATLTVERESHTFMLFFGKDLPQNKDVAHTSQRCHGVTMVLPRCCCDVANEVSLSCLFPLPGLETRANYLSLIIID